MMLRLLVVLALCAVAGCSHRDPLNPFVGPAAPQPFP
mgnify:CR=1 FL=1